MSKNNTNIELLSNNLIQIKPNIEKIFLNDKQKKDEFTGYLLQVFSDPKNQQFDIKELASCVYQLYIRKVNLSENEGFIINYSGKPTIQIGYKFVAKKLWETKEFIEMPIVFELREGDLIGFNPHTRDVKFHQFSIKSFQEQELWLKKKIIGWVLQAKMKNGNLINKFFFQQELNKHCKTYSISYKNESKIWKDYWYEMMRKTAFLRMVNYLPRNKQTVEAINDINKLNLVHYNEIDNNAETYYIDNPRTINIEKKSSFFSKTSDKNKAIIFNLFKKQKQLSKEIKYKDFDNILKQEFNKFINSKDDITWQKEIDNFNNLLAQKTLKEVKQINQNQELNKNQNIDLEDIINPTLDQELNESKKEIQDDEVMNIFRDLDN